MLSARGLVVNAGGRNPVAPPPLHHLRPPCYADGMTFAARSGGLLTSRSALSTALGIALCLVVGPLWFGSTSPARAALPGRAESVDVLRLLALGTTPIEVAGPAGYASAGGADGHAYGPPACDGDYSYRRVMAARAGVTLDLAEGDRWLDLVIRPVHEEREIALWLGDRLLSTARIKVGWQRVRIPLIDTPPGRHRFELRTSPTGVSLMSEANISPRVLALLHAVVVSSATRGPESTLAGPLFEADVAWLEAGTSIRVPIAPEAGQALQTGGLRTRGDTDDLRLVVERETLEGAVQPLLDWPAALELPWNLALHPESAREPVWLTLRVVGEAGGAIGLVAPQLTVPAAATAGATVDSGAAGRTVVIAVAGLRSDDTDAVGIELAGATRLTNVWSTSPTPRAALASLLTGQYPEVHGVVGRKDRLSSGRMGIGWAATRAGRKAVVRLGNLAVASDDKLWDGWADVKRATPQTYRGIAADVLSATADAIAATADEPVLAVAVLTDPTPPLMPRAGGAWQRFWPESAGKPPWKAGETRARLAALAAKGRVLSDKDRRWIRALRRGKVDETLRAISEFLDVLAKAPGAIPTRVVIVGLGGSDPDRLTGLDPDAVQVPVWTVGVALDAAATTRTSDLTDVAALIADVSGVPGVPGLQGAGATRPLASAWGDAAFASHGRRWDLAATDELVVLSDRSNGEVSTLVRGTAGQWLPVGDVSPALGLRLSVLKRGLGAWRAAGAYWRQGDFAPGAHSGGVGHGRACPR